MPRGPGLASQAVRSGQVVSVPVPGMGDSITSGDLLEWKVAVGDKVNADDVLAEIETDKVGITALELAASPRAQRAAAHSEQGRRRSRWR